MYSLRAPLPAHRPQRDRRHRRGTAARRNHHLLDARHGTCRGAVRADRDDPPGPQGARRADRGTATPVRHAADPARAAGPGREPAGTAVTPPSWRPHASNWPAFVSRTSSSAWSVSPTVLTNHRRPCARTCRASPAPEPPYEHQRATYRTDRRPRLQGRDHLAGLPGRPAGDARDVLVVWFAAKVFKVALLTHGRPPSFAALIKWARMA